ncbi:MAG TPA: glycosyltransferase family 39 protein [Bryobacteraceae bacterium]|nr:glycosyltransferase family 39 protein [Bryobacteraceae bacterium]
MSYLRRYFPPFTLVLAVICFYLYGLGSVGVLDPDEPRYLAIGHAMAQTRDLLIPKLWGTPWFEKPPLIYWMTALGAAVGLGPEVSGRLPVALLSLAFLALMFIMLRREFGTEPAAISSALLATCAGWLAFSSLALTDLPLSVFYSLAVFIALRVIGSPLEVPHTRSLFLMGICLGFATLAKGLVPIALAAPFLWFLRRRWRSWWIALVAIAIVALPWYLVMCQRFGAAFLNDFFWKHHFERLYSSSLQHVQPWWYYVPVLLGALFPWTPLLIPLALRGRRPWDERRFFLVCCVAWGFLLFSISLNKLPGYLLPLLPALFALFGASIDWRRLADSIRWWLMPSALLISLLPLVARALPQAIAAGRLTVPHGFNPGPTTFFYMGAPIAATLLARRAWTGILLVLCLIAGLFFVKIVTFPVLDRTISARGLFHEVQHIPGSVCSNWMNRDLEYGFDFYRGAAYPPCGDGKFDYALESRGRTLRIVRRSK